MGISNTVLQALEDNIRRSIGELRGINMLELGNQELGASSPERTAATSNGRGAVVARRSSAASSSTDGRSRSSTDEV